MNSETWQASFGGGHKLSDVTKKLHDNGKRAISHGTCPGVGIGGHATIVSRPFKRFMVDSTDINRDRVDWDRLPACGDLAWIMSSRSKL